MVVRLIGCSGDPEKRAFAGTNYGELLRLDQQMQRHRKLTAQETAELDRVVDDANGILPPGEYYRLKNLIEWLYACWVDPGYPP